MGTLTNGAKRSRRCGDTDTRATHRPPCSDTSVAGALAARTRAPAWLAALRDASRPPASHLKGDADGGTLQLFYLKEKKKKIPNHTKNKTNNGKEFRVALLALCALRRLPGIPLPQGPSAVHAHRIPARASGTDTSHQLCTTRPGHPPASPVAEGMGCMSGPLLLLGYRRTRRQGAVRASARVALISVG